VRRRGIAPRDIFRRAESGDAIRRDILAFIRRRDDRFGDRSGDGRFVMRF
jgi:hypothetical protein